MFNFIRKYRNFFSIIFVLAAAGMIFSLFGTGGAGGGGQGLLNAGNAAKVMGERITVNEFAQAFDYRWKEAQATMGKQFEGRDADPQTKAFIEQLVRAQVNPQSVLNGLIQQRFVIAVSKDMGFKVPTNAVKDLLSQNPLFQKNGKFDALTYKQYVRRPGDYENSLKQQLLRDALFFNFAIPLALVSENELEEAKKLQESFVFETLEVDPLVLVGKAMPSSSEVENALLDTTVAQEIKSYYDTIREEYEKPEQVKASHILIREENGGKAKADEIRADIASEKITFEDAAKKFSEDKSNASKGGDLGYFEHKVMDPKFADAAFALSVSEPLSGVIQSSFGFHIIKFSDRKAEIKKAFEEVSTEVATKYLSLQNAKDRVLAKLKGASQEGKALRTADLKELAVQWEEQKAWTPLEDSLGSISSSNLDLSELLKLSTKSQIYPRVVPQGDKYYLLRFVSRKPAELSANNLKAEKGAIALQHFLDTRLEELEKDEKVYRNNELVSQFEAQLQKF